MSNLNQHFAPDKTFTPRHQATLLQPKWLFLHAQLPPKGKIPAWVINSEEILFESNAIMNFLAKNSVFIPTDEFEYAQML